MSRSLDVSGESVSMTLVPDMVVTLRPTESLKAFGPQTRKHPEKQIKALMRSLSTFKLNRPFIVDEDGARLGGDAMWEAARRLEIKEVPTITIDHLTRAEKLAFKVADNRLAEMGEWNKDGLRAVFSEILELDVHFELDVIGFSLEEGEVILFGEDAAVEGEDDIVEPAQTPTSRLGDLYQLGEHRILCGDATASASYGQLMADDRAQAVIADSPWNLPAELISSKKSRGKFVQGSGEMSDAEFESFSRSWKTQAASVCVDGALLFSFIDWRGAFILQKAGKDAGLELKNQIIWNKLAGGMGSMYRTQYEVVLLFKIGKAPHINNVALGRHRLEQIERGELDRLLVTLPPRHMKSEMGSVAFTAWLMGRKPGVKILSTSYGQDLADKFHSDARAIMNSTWYARVFPKTAREIRRQTTGTLKTSMGGVRDATTLNGAITGFGYDYLIIDDPLKADEVSFPAARQHVQDLYQRTLQSRIEDKRKGRIIVLMQRLHEDDLAGHIIETGSSTHLNLPAIATLDEIIPLNRGRTHVRRIGDLLSPEREPMWVLDRLRAEMGNRAFMAQWQQDPTAADSAYVRLDQIQRYEVAPHRDRLFCVVQSWDTASSTAPTADFSVGTTWGWDGESWLLLDLVRVKLDYAGLLERVRLERDRWEADHIIVEKADVGPALLSDLGRDMRAVGPNRKHASSCTREAGSSRLGKHERLVSQIERLYSGYAKFPRNAQFLQPLERELTAFPNGKHDDQVDSLSQFLNWSVGSTGRLALADVEREASRRRRR